MKPDGFYNFLQELKRRRVFRGIVVYGASTLVLLESAEIILNAFGIEAVPKWFVILLGLGFFGSLWFSWIYDFTPGGIVKTKSASNRPAPIPQPKLKTYRLVTLLSVILIIGILSFKLIDNAAVKKIEKLEKSIAVLPPELDSLSYIDIPQFEFIGHEITSCLLKVRSYNVHPWEDTRKYPREGQDYSKMGEDLSATILVDWKPLMNHLETYLLIDLISVETGNLLSSEKYKIFDNWSGSEIIKCSRKISKKITRELRTFLTMEEREQMSAVPASPSASMYTSIGNAMTTDSWDLALTGKKAVDSEKSEYIDSISFERAIHYFTEAIKEDPNMAEAYANRAKARLWGYKARFFDRSVLDKSREDIEKASQINPDLPEVHVAWGFYYFYGLREYDVASIQFEKACELRPNNNEYRFYLSKIYTTLGKWPEVRILNNEVFEANPRNALFFTNLGFTFLFLNEYPKAILCQERAISLMPAWYAPYINTALAHVWMGNITEARASLFQAEENTGKRYFRFFAELDLYEGKYASAARNIELATDQEYKDLEESEGAASLMKAKIYKYADKQDMAEKHYRLAAEYYMVQVSNNPTNYYARSKLGIAFAGLGENQRAIESSQKALEMAMENYSAVIYPVILHDMAKTYVLTGDSESALKTLNILLDTPSPFSSEFIKIGPYLKPLLPESGSQIANL